MDHFVITIARGYGSGGRTIGKKLSEVLSVPFYDRDLIYMASEESGINVRLFGQADEHVEKGLFQPVSKPYQGGLIPPESGDFVSQENIFNYQAKVIKDLAQKQSCILIGRCADYILRDLDNVLRVFIWAPFDQCVSTVMDLQSLSEKDAAKKIKKIDRHRSEYYRYYTGRDWQDHTNYDLCLNTQKLGFDKTCDVIVHYLQLMQK